MNLYLFFAFTKENAVLYNIKELRDDHNRAWQQMFFFYLNDCSAVYLKQRFWVTNNHVLLKKLLQYRMCPILHPNLEASGGGPVKD